MNSRTIREIEEFVFQLLGILFHVGRIFLVIGGVFVLAIDNKLHRAKTGIQTRNVWKKL